MNLFKILNKDDYLMIKWPIAFGIVGLTLAVAIYLAIDTMASQSQLDLRIAQGEFTSARSRVELIEEEEARIIEYIGRYELLEEAGVVENEDRLQMFERVANLRAANNLFPVNLQISEQISMNLAYPQDISEPGDPIHLRSSTIGLDLPLLHEQDLVRLLSGILDSPGLFQTRECEISLQNTNAASFIILSQHFQSSCEILWYTFNLDPPQPVDPFGGF